MIEDWQHGGFGLYIHWPFCEAKCPYCDFNSHVQSQIDQTAWTKAYVSEIRRVGEMTQGRILRSVYFGGGTPSLMKVSTLETILDAVREVWNLANDVEVTLEANPGSVDVSRFRGYRAAGVNRVSLGVQALNDVDLKRLGRLHSAADARAAIEISQAEFERSSFDLIYGRQDQALEDWERELQDALLLCRDHISLYQLTIEQGTAFGDRYNAGRLRGLPSETLGADMYDMTQVICEAHGLPAYEISNHATVGQESRHNMVYWDYGDYAGIGPGAHGRLTLGGEKTATVAVSQPSQWLSAVDRQAAERVEPLSEVDQGIEYLMMGLRTSKPLDIERFERLSRQSFPLETARSLESMGFIRLEKAGLVVTPRGRPLLNAITFELTQSLG